MSAPYRVLITDALAPVAVERLEAAGLTADVQLGQPPERLAALAAEADAWLIRSGTRITAELLAAAPRLKIIGRAGVGVDNVDVPEATRRGVLVVNAPDGNTLSTAEHTCAMMLAMVRRLPQANASLRGGAWERGPFAGTELAGKTLGVIGVGKIGQAVATRMAAFGMRVLGYDPFLTAEAADRLGLTRASLETLWAEADVLTVHTPLSDATRGLIGAETLARCKRGVYVVNVARGGIVDEAALLEALESGHVAGAALDVYSVEPPPPALASLLAHPRVVATPHIAASTAEAQDKVAVHVAEEVVRAARGEPVTTPLNADAIRLAAQPEAAPLVALAGALGRVAAQVFEGPVARVVVRCAGEAPRRYAEPLVVAALAGVLARWADQPVNLVNAPALAREQGLAAEEQRAETDGPPYVEVALEGPAGRRCLRGLVRDDGARLVGFDAFRFELPLEGHLLFYQNADRPGMLAAVGAVLAEAGVNIAGLALGREAPGALALTVLATDEPVPPEALRAVAAIEDVRDVHAAAV
ncbi:MAG: phosphoglycerate dehydrogenase [Rubricoccaceae bacterium]